MKALLEFSTRIMILRSKAYGSKSIISLRRNGLRYAGYAEGGLDVDEYFAYEIDKYAIKTATHNFPMIKECGDVFKADFTQYENVDYLLAGFPCTKFSIAQKKDRETRPYSGEGWNLFEQSWRAVQEVRPKYFLFENNKSMTKEIQREISKIVGFEPICINSALVSAQNRNRLYWVGKRNPDGTYSKVDAKQPEDRGILLKDILDSGSDFTTNDKSWTLTASYNGAVPWNTIERCQRNMVAEPVNLTADGKSQTIKAQYNNTSITNACCYTSTYGATAVAEPIGVSQRDGYAKPCEWDDNDIPTKAKSYADNKIYTVYEVKDGQITIKNKQYPIKLADDYYIIRKLTVGECKRLQTVPEWYEFPVSDTQAYKMLGNSWTVDVIVHLIQATLE